MGNPVGLEILYTSHFADDQVLVVDDREDSWYMFKNLIEEYTRSSLKVNTKKTDYMVIWEEYREDWM